MRSSFTERGDRREVRGVAFVEALLVLAVLTTLWFGVRSLTRLGRERLEVSAEARHCAWRSARSGCTTLPAECSADETPLSGGDSKLDAARQRTPKTSEPAIDRRLQAQLDDLPGTRLRALAGRDVKGRLVRGGDRARATASISLPCAPRAPDADDLAPEMFRVLQGNDP